MKRKQSNRGRKPGMFVKNGADELTSIGLRTDSACIAARCFQWIREQDIEAPQTLPQLLVQTLVGAWQRNDAKTFRDLANMLEHPHQNGPSVNADPIRGALRYQLDELGDFPPKRTYSIPELLQLIRSHPDGKAFPVSARTIGRIARSLGVKLRGRGRPNK